MLSQLRGVFQRFALKHRLITVPGFPITDPTGRQIANIERITLKGRQVHVAGWTLAREVRLQGSDGETRTTPSILRHDVAEALGVQPKVGFSAAQAFGTGLFTLVMVPEAGPPISRSFTPFSVGALRLNRLKLVGRFAAQMLRLGPSVARWVATREPAARARVKAALGLQGIADALPLDPRFLTAETGAHPDNSPAQPVTLIIPVYNAFDLLQECLARVESHTDRPGGRW